MGDIIGEISERFNIRAKNFENHIEGNVLQTNDGNKYFIREAGLSPARLIFIHGAKEHLALNGLGNVERFLCSRDGEPYFFYKGKTFTLSFMHEGRECDFMEIEDVKRASSELAKLHIASKGYNTPNSGDEKSQLGRLPETYRKRMKEMNKLKNYALRGKGEFDHLFLDNAEFYSKLGSEAAERLEQSGYSEIVRRTEMQKSFCHHDYCHRNVVCAKDLLLIKGFDYSCREIWVKDIVDMLRRHLRSCNWPIENAKVILHEYCAVRPLEKDELEVMKIMLSFPYKFWSVCNKFYNSKRCWAEKTYVPKLTEILDEKKGFEQFLNQIDTL